MDLKPDIVYQDEYIAVINKPAGVIVNRADTTLDHLTLQDWVDNNLNINNKKLKINDETKDFITRSGIVHRLDKETSGLLIIAKDYISFLDLQKQFKEGKVEKTYVALSHGRVVPQEGEINVPIARLPWDRKKFGVVPMGRESKTLYKVLDYKTLEQNKTSETYTIIELYPKTGRTHQIRVHLRYLGFPIFGDELYAGRKNIRSDRKLLKRHFLHAKKIQFFHPVTQKNIQFTSPLPGELVDFLDILK